MNKNKNKKFGYNFCILTKIYRLDNDIFHQRQNRYDTSEVEREDEYDGEKFWKNRVYDVSCEPGQQIIGPTPGYHREKLEHAFEWKQEIAKKFHHYRCTNN